MLTMFIVNNSESRWFSFFYLLTDVIIYMSLRGAL